MLDNKLVGLNNASKKKREEALLKTEKAIAKLVKEQQKITIRSVAKEAGVSVSYIYKYPELAYKIQKLREEQKYSLVKSDRATKNIEKQVKKLQQEKAELIQEIAELRAIIDRTHTGDNSLEKLKTENIQLASQNQKLKQELEYTKQNLQQAREFILEQEDGYQSSAKLDSKIKIIQETS